MICTGGKFQNNYKTKISLRRKHFNPQNDFPTPRFSSSPKETTLPRIRALKPMTYGHHSHTNHADLCIEFSSTMIYNPSNDPSSLITWKQHYTILTHPKSHRQGQKHTRLLHPTHIGRKHKSPIACAHHMFRTSGRIAKLASAVQIMSLKDRTAISWRHPITRSRPTFSSNK